MRFLILIMAGTSDVMASYAYVELASNIYSRDGTEPNKCIYACAHEVQPLPNRPTTSNQSIEQFSLQNNIQCLMRRCSTFLDKK